MAVDAIARGHPAEMERKPADLGALRGEPVPLLGGCRRGAVAACRILDALLPGQGVPGPVGA